QKEKSGDAEHGNKEASEECKRYRATRRGASISAAVTDRRYTPDHHPHPAIKSTPQRGKSEDFGVMFAGEIVDPSEDRQVGIDLVFGGHVDKAVIFDVEIWSAEIDFFARIHKLRCDRRAQFFPPKIGTGNIDFVTWTSRQSRALRLRNVG